MFVMVIVYAGVSGIFLSFSGHQQREFITASFLEVSTFSVIGEVPNRLSMPLHPLNLKYLQFNLRVLRVPTILSVLVAVSYLENLSF